MRVKGGLRAQKDAEAKRAFFEAAMALFREKGVDGTSVEEIAERAGYSRATFFNHFGTKAGVFRYYGQTLAGAVDDLLAGGSAPASPLEGVRRILFALAGEADARREDLRVVFLHSLNDPGYLEGPTPARQRVTDALAELLGQAQAQGLVRDDLPARDLAFHVFSLYQSAIFAVVWGQAGALATMESAWRLLQGGLTGATQFSREGDGDQTSL